MSEAHLMLGTAGHIDHGKSSLVRALTGYDPDRLAEEKKRGITIELGFARLSLPGGRTMGVVDVPGHEKFVRQMVSGATGIDLALLVIAADDGWMPQTTEHVTVLELLGITSCVVALTKTDLVDVEWMEFIHEDIQGRLAATGFANSPIIEVSSRTGAGLDMLKQEIARVANNAQRTKESLSVRMPIDRAFTIKGSGTVVTGTLWSGTVATDDVLTLLPSELACRIRGIQIHGKQTKQAQAGNRVALNLAIDLDQVRPGDFLASPNTLEPTDRFDARYSYVDAFKSGKPFLSGTRVHVAHGTREVLGRVLLANGKEFLMPGESALAQIRLEEPLPVSLQDHFIVRSYSPVHVIGGGTVLTSHPRRRTTLNEHEETLLRSLEAGKIDEALLAQLELTNEPLTPSQLSRLSGIELPMVQASLDSLTKARKLSLVGAEGRHYLIPSRIMKFTSQVERELIAFHAANPESTGMSKEAVRHRVCPTMKTESFSILLEEAERSGKIVQSQGEISHIEAGAGAKALEREAAAKLLNMLVEDGPMPRPYSVLLGDSGLSTSLANKAIRKLDEEEKIVRLDSETIYAASVIKRHKETISDFINKQGPATTAQLKELMNTSRKYAIPLLEYFDKIGFTEREEDTRKLG
ncbi:MAG: selenocysteine-specific translation elongation factor [Coriobacteriia bacterium]|nr:selenocysteine-specific translation elongation factor [Coriobacteriia bacterium]